ncbi:hypothetical protein P4H70_12340 [Paenibacillus ehimensis]|uniref:hypothetical protein n=1 Tax=Paenibacillus ehimensis TaxID=79264 RepID=UPI002DB5BD15|nr:hypothetical protein [Paenibacillus ehimensis]MEC0209720.1 hypothetical protein [Paenibacillus ehimensis]
MKKYDEKYIVTTESGSIHIAYFRKGEYYDWWEEETTLDEIRGIVSYDEIKISLNEKQVKLLNWMFNYCRIAMLRRNDEHSNSDIQKLTKYIYERFPSEASLITELLL